jgi:hypothetical protein
MSFDGEHHRVYYSSDGDSEELSDYELDDVEIPVGTRKSSATMNWTTWKLWRILLAESKPQTRQSADDRIASVRCSWLRK